jgi:putative hydrolase of the HAD superfamily
VFADPDTQNLVKTHIFAHSDWLELDRGTLSLGQAVDRGASRTGLPHSEIQRLIDEVPSSLTPIPGTAELIRSVKVANNKLFILSNMQFESIAYLEENYDIWGLFDGIVISCRIQKVKPEKAIYEHLLSEHQLNASETVFIDDMRANLTAAAALGIQTIQFMDPIQCRKELALLGCL